MIIMLKKFITLPQTGCHLQPKLIFPFSTAFNAKIDYFKVLELDKSASVQQIKAAFLTKAKEFHPDVNPKYEERFKMINQAYKILSDENIRRQYQRIRQSVQDSEEYIDSQADQSTEKQRDPILKQIERNTKYFQLLKKQALNAHIASQYRPKSSKQRLVLRQKQKDKGKGTAKFIKFLIWSSFALSAMLIFQIAQGLTIKQAKIKQAD